MSGDMEGALKDPIDWTDVKMDLFTAGGLLKYSTDCAPNGYYFIPVYDKGQFYLQVEGPEGWMFEPNRYEFSVSENSQGCSEEDINFIFTGFALSGSVVTNSLDSCTNPNAGPEGVILSLTLDGSSKPLATTVSSADGSFSFDKVFPGSYTVQASHSSWQLQATTQQVNVAMSNAMLPDPFKLTGYQLHGKVESEGEPISNVQIFLYSTDASTNSELLPCSRSLSSNVKGPNFSKTPLCMTETSEDGSFNFSELPCGRYQVVPFYQSSVTTFTVSPEQAVIDVNNHDASFESAFQVTGFSAVGKVVGYDGQGVEGVSIYVNSELQAVTDETGAYHLNSVTSSETYDISAEKEHYTFASLKKVRLSASSASSISDINVQTYDICGTAAIGEPAVKNREMVLRDENNRKLATTSANTKGEYCFAVRQGTYLITPVLSSSEQAKGTLLSPQSRRAVLSNQPLFGLDFLQEKLQVGGRVKCLGNCASTIKLSLKSTDNPSQEARIEELSTESPKQENGETFQYGSFSFQNVVPGAYDLSLVDASAWCWDNPSLNINIQASSDASEMEDLLFVQTGFSFETRVSHPIQLHVELTGGAKKTKTHVDDIQLRKGYNRVCLPHSGTYNLKPISCYRFDNSEYSFDTTAYASAILRLDAIDFQVTGSVILPSETKKRDKTSASPASTLPVSVRLCETIPSHEDGQQEESCQNSVVDATLVQGKKDQDGDLYEYSLWASPTQSLNIRVDPTDKYLFYPRSKQIQLHEDQCPPPVPAFSGRPGVFASGAVSPAVAGVSVTLTPKSNTDGPTITVKTNAKGEYNAGPLYEDEDYIITASGQGYQFMEDRSKAGYFKALKLGNIKAIVEMKSNGKKTKAERLPEVLLSLSGDRNYRNNSQTDENGECNFANLYPATYFLRPLLKEYEFSPSHVSIELNDKGEDDTVTFTATRTAYSVFGKVTSLNGDPEPNVLVGALQIATNEANIKKLRYEEATTDDEGHYRIRGLIAGSSYAVSVQTTQATEYSQDEWAQSYARIERGSPDKQVILVPNDDTKNINFVAFHTSTKFDLTGQMEVENVGGDWIKDVEVLLARASSPQNTLAVATASASFGFFSFLNLPIDEYVVTLRAVKDASQSAAPGSASSIDSFSVSSTSTTVLLNQHSHVQVSISATANVSMDDDLEGGSLSTLLFFGLICLAVWQYELVSNYITSLTGRKSSKSSSSSEGWDATANTRKRSGKSKKKKKKNN